MKIRSGYVSNSSSSSFILKSESDIEKFYSFNGACRIRLFRMKNIRNYCLTCIIKYLVDEEDMKNYLKELENRHLLPNFILNNYLRYYPNLEYIKNSVFSPEIKDEYYITGEIDRDEWSEDGGYMFGFQSFEEDL